MKILTWITAFLFAASLSAADRDCDPVCVDPYVCDEKTSGTCCCPFPAHAYPSVGTGEYHILDAYRIEIASEVFSTSDNALSDFWSLWDEPATDFVELNATSDGNIRERSATGFQSEGDALVRAKAAWNDSGLFLCLTVRDDSWDSTEAGDSLWARDAVEVYLAPYGTPMMDALPHLFPELSTNKLLPQTAVIRSRIGHPERPADLRFADEDASLSAGGIPPDEHSEYPVRSETVILSETIRAQEWYIPFPVLGAIPQPGTVNDRKALCLGYADADAEQFGSDYLYWRNAGAPIHDTQDWATGQSAFFPVEAWGDIRFQEDGLATPRDSLIVVIPVTPDPRLDTRPLFRWHPHDSIETYTLSIARDSLFQEILLKLALSDTSYTPNIDLPAANIYWRVTGPNETASEIDHFYIQPDSIPFIHRFNGDTVPDPVFSWMNVTGFDTYSLQVSAESSFGDAFLKVPVTDTSYPLDYTLDEGMYYWRVAAGLAGYEYCRSDSFYLPSPTEQVNRIPPANSPAIARLSSDNRLSVILPAGHTFEHAELLDPTGRIIEAYHPEKRQTGSRAIADFAIGGLPSGLYFVKVRSRAFFGSSLRQIVLTVPIVK